MNSVEDSNFMNDLAIFKHEPLSSSDLQIRLVKLVVTKENVLSLELSYWPATQSPDYIAISYTWGDESNPCLIFINGKQSKVRQNCHYALRQVSKPYPSDYIWIDSICINQDDVQEKGSQVRNMANVYANAKRVCICVGPRMDRSELLETYAEELTDINLKLQRKEILHADFNQPDDTPNEKLLDPYPKRSQLMLAWESVRSRKYVEDAITEILAFTRRPYWTRLWIVQEIAFAKSKIVLCGAHQLQWEAVRLFHNLTWNFSYSAHFSTVICYAEPHCVSLAQAIRFFSAFLCSDVRDHIFGILGLIDWTPEESSILQAGYSLSLHDLLLRVISSLKCNNPVILQAMKLLGFQPQSPQIRELLILATGSSEDPRSDVVDRSGFSTWLQTWLLRDHELCQIDEDLDGRLTIHADRETRENFYHVASADYSLYPYRNGSLPAFAVPLYNGESLAALACTGISKGDLLASIWYHRPDILLLLRHCKDDTYTIVGQAISVNGFSIKSNFQYTDSAMLLALSAEELYLLWSQDFIGDGDTTLAEYESFDAEMQLQRVLTKVVLFPNILLPRVRIQLSNESQMIGHKD